MELRDILIGGVAGVAASVVTAYMMSRLQIFLLFRRRKRGRVVDLTQLAGKNFKFK